MRQLKVKLQFSKSKRDYLNGKGTYLSDKVSLHFPKKTHEFFLPLKGRHLAIDVSKKDKTVHITLTELDARAKHKGFKRAIEVWNRNIENGCIPKANFQKHLRWKRLSKKTHGVFGLAMTKTIQCCIDSPKYAWEYGAVWTIFTSLPHRRLNYSRIYSYYKSNSTDS